MPPPRAGSSADTLDSPTLVTALPDEAITQESASNDGQARRRDTAGHIEELAKPVAGDRLPFSSSPSLVTPVPQPHDVDALPATGDPLPEGFQAFGRTQMGLLQLADPLAGAVIRSLRSGLDDEEASLPSGVRYHRENCCYENGILYWKGGGKGERRVFLPRAVQDLVLSVYHDRMGHHGHKLTQTAVMSRFYAPGLRSNIRNYVNNCAPCAKGKVDRHKAGRARSLFRGEHPWDVVTLDVYEVGFEVDGYDHILIMVCNLTGWVRAVALKGPGTAEQILNIFMHEVVRNEGTPRFVRSDRGSNLTSEVWALFCKAFGITPEWGAPYMHTTAGLAERFLQALGVMMRVHRIAAKDQAWPNYLASLEMSFNFTRGRAFYLNRGREARVPYDLALYGFDALRARCIDGASWVKDITEALHAAWDAKDEVLNHQSVARANSNNNKRELNLKFEVNSPVLLRRMNKRGKWSNPFFDEPYRIGEVLENDNYILKDLHNRRLRGGVHVSMLKPYPLATNDGEVALGDDEAIVKRVVARRLVEDDDGNPALQYRLRFRGEPPENDLWFFAEAIPNLADLIRVFDTVIKPLSLKERGLLDGIADRRSAAGPRPARDPSRYGPRHFRRLPARNAEDAEDAEDAEGAEGADDEAGANNEEGADGEGAVDDDEADAAAVAAECDEPGATSSGSGPTVDTPAFGGKTYGALSPDDFIDHRGVGISAMRWESGQDGALEPIFKVGRAGAFGIVRSQWRRLALLRPEESEMAEHYTTACRLASPSWTQHTASPSQDNGQLQQEAPPGKKVKSYQICGSINLQAAAGAANRVCQLRRFHLGPHDWES